MKCGIVKNSDSYTGYYAIFEKGILIQKHLEFKIKNEIFELVSEILKNKRDKNARKP